MKPLKSLIVLAVISQAAIAARAAEPVDSALIRIDAARVENPISTELYAAFAEMMAEDVKWGLTAELVHDRSFEEAADYLGLPAHWRLEPDERNDNASAIKFAQTTEEAYPTTSLATGNAEHSLKVTAAPQDITDARRGFSQGRISVTAGQTYNGYLWIKVPVKGGYQGEIRVLLEEDNTDGEIYAATGVVAESHDWRRYDFALKPARSDRFAKLTFLVTGKGTLYVDQVSLEPATAVREVRADSEAMIRDLHPSFLRWPGGAVAQFYHWKWGVGPRDLRPVFVNKAWASAPEPNDLGTDEYLAMCARLHMEPSITVNVDGDGATAEEAAAWVEYVNGPATSKYGAMRAANGHPGPYKVRQWELGNELWGSDQYPEAALKYANAMRAVDPTLKLIAVGASPWLNAILGKDRHFDSGAWNAAVLKVAGPAIDFLAIHDYSLLSLDAGPEPRARMMARPAEYAAAYRHIAAEARRYVPHRDIRLIVNEWNLFYPSEVIQSMEGAVYASRMMNGFERDGAIVAQSNISDLLNGWVGGTIQASRDRIYGTAQYYAVRMYNDALGTERLHTDVTSPELANGVAAIDAVASRSADGSTVFVKASNASLREVTARIDLQGFEHVHLARLVLLSGAASGRRNSFADPQALLPVASTLECGEVCAVRLPGDSVAILELTKAH